MDRVTLNRQCIAADGTVSALHGHTVQSQWWSRKARWLAYMCVQEARSSSQRSCCLQCVKASQVCDCGVHKHFISYHTPPVQNGPVMTKSITSCRKNDQLEQLHRLHTSLQEEFDTYRQTATTDISNLTYVNQARYSTVSCSAANATHTSVEREQTTELVCSCSEPLNCESAKSFCHPRPVLYRTFCTTYLCNTHS